MARIAIFLPNLRPGGAERVNVNLANAFADAGHAVDMVLMEAHGAFLRDLSPRVNVVDLKAPRARNALVPLTRYLRRARPQALLACMWPLTLVSVWARWLSRTPMALVLSEHTTWSRSELVSGWLDRWRVRASMRLFFPFADSTVAVSEGAARDLERFARLPRGAVEVVFNPIVSDAHASRVDPPAEPAAWCRGPHRRILAVGTLKAVKDYGTLLLATARVSQTEDVRVLILGEGECRAELQAQITRLGLERTVFMPGFVHDPAPYFQHAHLVVLSSIAEGLPTVLVEALAAGTQVVSTDCESGPREILCHGRYGRLVPVGDAPALADAIRDSFAAAPQSTALQRRAQDFSVRAASKRYLELLGLAPQGTEGQMARPHQDGQDA